LKLNATTTLTDAAGKARKKSNRNNPKFDVRTRLYQMCGVDLTRIDGIDVCTAMTVLSEVGVDMSKFPTAKHFAAWLGLCPGTKISGGKVLGSKTQPNTQVRGTGAPQVRRAPTKAMKMPKAWPLLGSP
jgi:transposase